MPDPSAVSLLETAGHANPLSTTAASPTGTGTSTSSGGTM
jgi:hypothetical protein